MRELTESEMTEVAGGDGIRLPGNNYISGVNGPLKLLGVAGAFSSAFSVGYAAGTAIDSYGGYSSRLGGWMYDQAHGDGS